MRVSVTFPKAFSAADAVKIVKKIAPSETVKVVIVLKELLIELNLSAIMSFRLVRSTLT